MIPMTQPAVQYRVPFSKRAFDLVLTVPGTLLLLPVMLIVAILVRIKLGSPVIFAQKRPGLNCRIFTLYKFRTMNDARDDQGKPLPDAERLTRLGRFLRSASLDELPELFNILAGQMSLVGPRPLLISYLDRYTPEQLRRQNVLPGLTGWAQVNGRNAISWEEKFKLDIWYVDHWSLALDFKILWMTFSKVFNREAISAPGQATVGEFLGSAANNKDKSEVD
jgi:lipopolysaccharide/colanic/teichoic acid biosynthesis glycosyltransferase